MTLLISENWRRVLAAVAAAVVLVGLGVAIGSVSSSSGSTPAATHTITTTSTKTVRIPSVTPGSASQATKLKAELAASGTQVKTLERQLRVTRQRNKQLRARLAGHTTTKGK